MKKVIPYKTVSNAMKSLDNGGRFYNLLTDAGDGKISAAELSRAAGVLTGKQQMVLYLEMALQGFDASRRQHVLSALSPSLKKAYTKYQPDHFVPSEALQKGEKGRNAIITGIPRFVDAKTEFAGFIMIPISTGKTTTFVMVPIFEQYDVYQIRDEPTSKKFLIAHARQNHKLKEERTRCGGILKELKQKKSEDAASSLFLETFYYTTGLDG